MPYIIAVNRPGCLPEQDPYAVATLEEAREAAAAVLDDACGSYEREMNYDEQRADHARRLAVRDMPADGGVIGPLPDGYVIDVQHVTDAEVAAFAGVSCDDVMALTREALIAGGSYDDALTFTREALIDAYNAAA